MFESRMPLLVHKLGCKQHPKETQSSEDENVLTQLFKRVQPVRLLPAGHEPKNSQSVMYVKESDVEEALHIHITGGIQDHSQNKPHEALLKFKQAEQILTVHQSDQNYLHYFLILKINLGNMLAILGISFYQLGWLENAFTCFEDAILVLKKHPSDDIKLGILKLHCYLQCCIILSEIGQHKEALAISKITIKKAIKQMLLLHAALNNSPSQRLLEEILKRNKILPIVKEKYQIMFEQFEGISKTQDCDTIFNDLPSNFVDNSTILSFLQLQPINSELFQYSSTVPSCAEYTHIICLFVVSLYCNSTESRFIEMPIDPEQFTEAEDYLSRALEIVYLFLPKEMPLVTQLINVHTKFHGIHRQVIHEDDKQSVDNLNIETVLLKPIVDAQKCGFFIPVIRKSKLVQQAKERAKSLKDTQFKKRSNKPELELDSLESKPLKKKLRSLSTSYKNKPNSPKWGVCQAAEIYLQKVNAKPTIPLRRPPRTTFNNQTAPVQKQSQQSQLFFEQPNKNTSKRPLNINFLIINNLNHINYSGSKKRSSSFNFDQLRSNTCKVAPKLRLKEDPFKVRTQNGVAKYRNQLKLQ